MCPSWVSGHIRLVVISLWRRKCPQRRTMLFVFAVAVFKQTLVFVFVHGCIEINDNTFLHTCLEVAWEFFDGIRSKVLSKFLHSSVYNVFSCLLIFLIVLWCRFPGLYMQLVWGKLLRCTDSPKPSCGVDWAILCCPLVHSPVYRVCFDDEKSKYRVKSLVVSLHLDLRLWMVRLTFHTFDWPKLQKFCNLAFQLISFIIMDNEWIIICLKNMI